MNVPLTKKMFVLVALTLLMWVPLLMIENTVSERAGRRDSVQQDAVWHESSLSVGIKMHAG